MTLDPVTSTLIGVAWVTVCVILVTGPSLLVIGRGLRRRFFGPRPRPDHGDDR